MSVYLVVFLCFKLVESKDCMSFVSLMASGMVQMIASCLLNLDHVIIGTNDASFLIVKVYMSDNFYFYGLLKHYCLIILRLAALLNWVDINFKDSRERHIRRTCTSEPQRELIFSWYLKKHSISIFGYTSPKETITNFQKANIRKYL